MTELIIISGRSGAGKSVALRSLEDAGYYCVDNIPITLISELLNHLYSSTPKIAVSVDIRNFSGNAQEFENILAKLPANITSRLIFLECDRNTLIQRYSDSRRRHPLSNQELSLEQAIDLENRLLAPMVIQANCIIDTTQMSSHALSEKLRELLCGTPQKVLQIIVESFGFKYGIPVDADYVFDVRFLPNPHWDISLRAMTGLDQGVIDFLNQHMEVTQFVEKTCEYIAQWLPRLENNNRSYLKIAIGCTGGKHRSVFIAEQIGKFFEACGKSVTIHHRSLAKYHQGQ